MDYETDSSSFETSELLADFLASTPLLADSWKLCALSNVSAPRGFLTEVIGGIGYLAFSGVQVVSETDPRWCFPVALESAAEGLFTSLKCHSEEDEEEKPVRIHSGFLRLFLDFYESEQFQAKIAALLERNKLIVITGHSIGATVASITALWLLNRTISSSSSTSSILCISYGSPLLGNVFLSLAVLRERWGGNFCHVVSSHDLIPRLLFAPPNTEHLHSFLHLLQFQSVSDAEITELFKRVVSAQELAATEDEDKFPEKTSYWPFGTYVFCSMEGAICLENVASIVKMMHLLCSTNCPRRSVEDHFKYRDYVEKLHLGFFKRRYFKRELSESSYEASVSLALESSGIDQQESIIRPARDCLEIANQNCCQRNLNVARLAIKLSKINPERAQIEWYKDRCDQSDDQLGYYDTFKQRRANKREQTVNMKRLTLARFWDNVIGMWERNELPYDFHTRSKWIYGSQMYKLRLEPLDIADYYRSNKHREKGHYIKHGRERRYQVFDRWWKSAKSRDNNRKRSKYASLTQDSMFWARVEEAKDCVESIKIENDLDKLNLLVESIAEFEKYASRLIERKEVSKDVLFKNSSYSVWAEEWRMLKVQLGR